jgi:CDP-diacylglycerol---glycerol-3-phosphate 3-phosphatidyltransferase
MAFMTTADHIPKGWSRTLDCGPAACYNAAERLMNLPNALTVTRIFLVPLLVVVLLTKFDGHAILGVPTPLVGAAIFGLASVTDWLDGYLARRRGQVTALGRMMDPIADKLLTSAAFISLVQLGLAPAWIVAVIIGRELAVTGLRSLASARGVGFGASSLGKIKMVAQVTAILLLILGQNGAQPFLWLGQVSLWIVLLTALVSALDYYRNYQAAPGPADVADFEEARRRSRRTG